MIVTLFILVIGLAPPLFSVWILRRADARAQERLRLAIDSVSTRGLPRMGLSPEHHYVEGIGYMIGDLTCRFNARSSYIRCAINPMGPCQGCSQYQERDLPNP
ncbi:MAG TPA: DUF6464 family protein [Trichocoleus sp.]